MYKKVKEEKTYEIWCEQSRTNIPYPVATGVALKAAIGECVKERESRVMVHQPGARDVETNNLDRLSKLIIGT